MDVIVLLDVIEHLPDPHETLALCVRHLNPGGIVVLTTGDFGSPVARLLGAQLAADDAAPAPVVLHRGKHAAPGGATAAAPGKSRSSVEDRSTLAGDVSIAAHVRPPGGRRPRGPSNVGLPVNLFDAMRVVFRKAGA